MCRLSSAWSGFLQTCRRRFSHFKSAICLFALDLWVSAFYEEGYLSMKALGKLRRISFICIGSVCLSVCFLRGRIPCIALMFLCRMVSQSRGQKVKAMERFSTLPHRTERFSIRVSDLSHTSGPCQVGTKVVSFLYTILKGCPCYDASSLQEMRLIL